MLPCQRTSGCFRTTASLTSGHYTWGPAELHESVMRRDSMTLHDERTSGALPWLFYTSWGGTSERGQGVQRILRLVRNRLVGLSRGCVFRFLGFQQKWPAARRGRRTAGSGGPDWSGCGRNTLAVPPRKNAGCRARGVNNGLRSTPGGSGKLVCRWFCVCDEASGKLRRLRLPLPPGKELTKSAGSFPSYVLTFFPSKRRQSSHRASSTFGGEAGLGLTPGQV